VTADAVSVASQFLSAILWGEHQRVWELLRLGTSPLEERDSFLTGLVHGLRVDFSSVTLQDVRPAGEPLPLRDGSFQIQLECPSAFGAEAWAAGSLIVSAVDNGWRVDRVYPLVSRSD